MDTQLADQGEIALVLLKHRIDQHPLAGGHIGQEIGEGAGGGVEELAEEQAAATGGKTITLRVWRQETAQNDASRDEQ
jgi:hypothetical protein